MATRKTTKAAGAAAAPFDAQTERMIAALTGARSPARTALVELVLDHVMQLKPDDLIDPDEVVALIVAVPGSAVDDAVGRHAAAGRARLKAQFATSGDRPMDLMDDHTRAKLVKILSEAPPPRAAWAKDAVDPALVRQLVAPVLQDMLLSFTKKLPLPGLAAGAGASAHGSSGGLLGGLAGRVKARVETQAEKLVDASRNLLGGLGEEMERRVQGVARDFSHGATSELKSAFEARLSSPEGRDLSKRIQAQALETVMKTKLAELWRDTDRMPLAEVDALAGAIWDHSRERKQLVDFVRAEVKGLLAIDGQRTIGELLEMGELLDPSRAMLAKRLDGQFGAVFSGARFGTWLDGLVQGSRV